MDIDLRLFLLICIAIIFAIFLVFFPVEQIGITRFDPKHGNAILVQDGLVQVLIAGGSDASILNSLSTHMSWFDRKIEVVIVPTLKSEDITGLIPILNRYNVGTVVLPGSKPSNEQAKMLISELLRRNIPYRFASYGDYVQTGGILMRFMSPVASNQDITLRIDMRGLSMIVLGNADPKVQQQLITNVPSAAFSAQLFAMEQHGVKQPSSTSNMRSLISPVLSLSDMPNEASISFQSEKWLMKCYDETNLPFLQHYCIH